MIDAIMDELNCLQFWNENEAVEDGIQFIFLGKDNARIKNIFDAIKKRNNRIQMSIHKFNVMGVCGKLSFVLFEDVLDLILYRKGIRKDTNIWFLVKESDACINEVRQIKYICDKQQLDELIMRWVIEMLTSSVLDLGRNEYYDLLISTNNLILGGVDVSDSSIDSLCQKFIPQQEKMKKMLNELGRTAEIDSVMISVDGVGSLKDAEYIIVENTIGTFFSSKTKNISFGIGDVFYTGMTMFFVAALEEVKERDYIFQYDKDEFERMEVRHL